MFRIAICDDNKYDIREISSALDTLRGEGYAIELTTYTDGREIVADFKSGIRYHLLILDMVMEPVNGIDTAKELREYDLSMPILIVTSTRDFALDGYLVNAWRYLTKPLDKERFLSEVRQILNHVSAKDDRYFAFESDRNIVKIKIDDILYFESNLHTITIHTVKENYSFRGTMTKIDDNFRDEEFFRVHKSFLVNLKYVSSASKQSLKMVNGEELPVSKMRADALHEALLDYVTASSIKQRL